MECDRVVVHFWSGDVRECLVEGDVLVHVLNPAYRIHRFDSRIVKITPVL